MHDLNGDGLKDIIYKTNLDIIAWLENLDGLGNFGSEQIIANTSYPYTFSFEDMDNDGDIDVFANLYHDSFNNRLVWYENTDGQGNFSNENIIEIGEFYGDGGGSILLNFDLDNDGDYDVITSYEGYASSKLIWYENLDGQGDLSIAQELHQFQYNPLSDFSSISSLGFADVNGDSKMDLIASTFFDDGEFYGHNIVWLENLDGQGAFGTPEVIYADFNTYLMVFYDLDNDGDIDILKGHSSHFSWFENSDGLGDFNNEILISDETNGLRDIRAADFNKDGLLDIVTASIVDDKVAWYENLGPLGIDDSTKENFVLYPNPTATKTTVRSKKIIQSIRAFDCYGNTLKTVYDSNEIDLSELSTGVYFIRIEDINGFTQIQKI
ncbi:MAG: T9SS type A sorting domain-containing protein, partial [Flavobacteriaceae bacterium]|nr:T9SS type A sorting domain-containing protein [Flavobacteriaceae bacterium]